MKFGCVFVYYNEKYGFIFTSETTIKGRIIRVTINPIIMADSDISVEQTGKYFFEALNKSRSALPVERSEIENYKFWEATKIKSFSAFSKKFICLRIEEKENTFEFEILQRESDGGYGYSGKSENKSQLRGDSDEQTVGKKISRLFSKKIHQDEEEQLSFKTLNNSIVEYTKPCYDFEDAGDGNTDAYQIYVYEKERNNYIAFLTDNNYSEINANAIRIRWEQIYGKLNEYEYTQENGLIKIKAYGKTDKYEVHANFFRDSENLTEVMLETDNALSHDKRKKILNEYDKLINSIKIIDCWGITYESKRSD